MTKFKIIEFAKKFKILRILYHRYKSIKNKLFLKPRKRTKPAIIQLVPALIENDAVGNMVVKFSEKLNKRKIQNYILSNSTNYKNYPKNFVTIPSFQFHKKDTLFYHMPIGSNCSQIFIEAQVRKKILLYHNITPPHYFKKNSESYKICVEGLRQIKKIKNYTNVAIVASDFSKKDLEKNGYTNVLTIPIMTKVDDLLKLRTKKNTCKDKIFIFVGRIETNKRIEDIITLFYEINIINKRSKLILIGSIHNEAYKAKLDDLVNKLNIVDSVTFTGMVTNEKLAYYYSNADAFLCMSEHEGFCVPLVESLAFDVPVFAYRSSAIGDTLGSAGILFNQKNNKKQMAATICNVLQDKNKLEKITNNSRNRFRYFSNDLIFEKYTALLNIKK